MLAEYATLAALLKPLRTRREPPNPNQKFFFSDENNFWSGWKDKQPEWQIDVFWPWGCFHCHAQPELAAGQPDGLLVEGNVASQLTDCNPLDYFMWCVFEREVNKCSHITLSSLKVMTSDLMTDLDREVIIHAGKKFQPWIEAVKEATGVFIK
jgi:hypothetical protein